MKNSMNNVPEEITADDDNLYDLSLDELEQKLKEPPTEQPSGDSDSIEDEEQSSSDDINQDSEDGEEEESDDTDNPTETDQLEGDGNDAETTEESSDSDKPNEKEVETYKVKAVGTEIEFTLDELKELASKGMDYTKKMQEIAPWKKQIAMMKEHSVSQEDVNLLIDLKKGNKDAVMSLMKENGIDPLDVDFDQISYRPNDYSMTDNQLALRDAVHILSQDKEVFTRTEQVVDREWDSVSRAKLLSDTVLLQGLHTDIKSGMYDKVMPNAMKLKALDGGIRSDLDYYIEAGRRYVQDMNKSIANKSTDTRQMHQKDIDANANRRKAATLPKSSAGSKKDVINYLDEIPDEDYKKWLKKVEEKF